jgi:hypothetical protein
VKGAKSPEPFDRSYSPAGVAPEARMSESRDRSTEPARALGAAGVARMATRNNHAALQGL